MIASLTSTDENQGDLQVSIGSLPYPTFRPDSLEAATTRNASMPSKPCMMSSIKLRVVVSPEMRNEVSGIELRVLWEGDLSDRAAG